MARPRSLRPKYCLHKPSGRAYVTLDGQRVYLGANGSQESRDADDREIGAWIQRGRQLAFTPMGGADDARTVAHVAGATQFVGHALSQDRRKPLAPRREPIRRWATRGWPFDKEKILAENLRPPGRYLLKQVGRPWRKVHAEFAARFGRNSAVQMHVWRHALAMVEQHAFYRGRELFFICSSRSILRFGNGLRRGTEFPLTRRDSVAIVYVCPRSGLLERVPEESKATRAKG